ASCRRDQPRHEPPHGRHCEVRPCVRMYRSRHRALRDRPVPSQPVATRAPSLSEPGPKEPLGVGARAQGHVCGCLPSTVKKPRRVYEVPLFFSPLGLRASNVRSSTVTSIPNLSLKSTTAFFDFVAFQWLNSS